MPFIMFIDDFIPKKIKVSTIHYLFGIILVREKMINIMEG